jgi:hypothetical protein
MDDVSLLFKDIIIPIAPSILYERPQYHVADGHSNMRKKSKSSMRAELFLNLATFIERGTNTSNSRRTPTATPSKNTTITPLSATILRKHK